MFASDKIELGARVRFRLSLWHKMQARGYEQTNRQFMLDALVELRRCVTFGDFKEWRIRYDLPVVPKTPLMSDPYEGSPSVPCRLCSTPTRMTST